MKNQIISGVNVPIFESFEEVLNVLGADYLLKIAQEYSNKERLKNGIKVDSAFNLTITKLRWPAAEAQPRMISYKDRAVTVYISENQELTVEIGGDFILRKADHGLTTITLESDL